MASIRCRISGHVAGSSLIEAVCGCPAGVCLHRDRALEAGRLAAMPDSDAADGQPLNKQQKVARDVSRVVSHIRGGHTTAGERRDIIDALERSERDRGVGRAIGG